MRKVLDTGIPPVGQPFSWAVEHGGVIYTAHGPVTEDGKILQEDMRAQVELTLKNLEKALAAGGATLDDVLQVQAFLLAKEDVAVFDEVYASMFNAPYPNRMTVIVAGLTAPGMRIELSVTAAVPARP